MTLRVLKTFRIAFFLGLVINAEVADTNTSFRNLFCIRYIPTKITFLATVVVYNGTSVFFLVVSNRIWVGSGDPFGWGRLWVLFLVSSLLHILLLSFLTTLLRGFYTSGVVVWACCPRFFGLALGLLISRVCHWVPLNLNLSCSGVA